MMKKIKYSLVSLLTLTAIQISAQDAAATSVQAAPAEPGVNPLFLSMGILTGVLLLVIIILASVLKTSVRTKVREAIQSKAAMLFLLMLPLGTAMAQTNTPAEKGSLYIDSPIGGLHPMAFYSLFVVLLLELFVILWLCLMILRIIVKKEAVSAAAAGQKTENSLSRFISRKIFGVKPVESDKDVMLDHDYDGIKELDNDLPPWWKYGFYMTIISSVVYLVGYHITNSFKLSNEEYAEQLSEGERMKQAYRNKMAMNIDETNAQFLSDAAAIEKGKSIFAKNCVTCHGEKAEGKVGPNLTDDYWIYGGSAGNVFKTVKFGTSKGMQAWKETMSPSDIQNVISFLHSIKGSNPPGALAPQGELYKGDAAVSNAADTTKNSVSDSSKSLEIK